MDPNATPVPSPTESGDSDATGTMIAAAETGERALRNKASELVKEVKYVTQNYANASEDVRLIPTLNNALANIRLMTDSLTQLTGVPTAVAERVKTAIKTGEEALINHPVIDPVQDGDQMTEKSGTEPPVGTTSDTIRGVETELVNARSAFQPIRFSPVTASGGEKISLRTLEDEWSEGGRQNAGHFQYSDRLSPTSSVSLRHRDAELSHQAIRREHTANR